MNTLENDTLLATVNPEGVAYSLKPAGLVARALAFGVDNIITASVLGIIAAIGSTAGISLNNWIYLLIMFVIQWFYHVAWEIFGRGATPGKKIFGLKVVADDGSPVSPGSSFTRSLLRFADTFMGLTLIGGLSIIFSPGFRRLGDWAASTLVIYSKPGLKQALVSSAALNVKMQIVPLPLKGEDKANIIAFARRYDQFGKERADEIASQIVSVIAEKTDEGLPPGEFLLGVGASLSGESSRK